MTLRTYDDVTETHDHSAVLQNMIVCDSVHRAEQDSGCFSGPAGETSRPPDPGPPTTRLTTVDGQARPGRTLAGRGGLPVLGGVRAWWSKSEEVESSRRCADRWQESLSCRRRSAQEEISFALTSVSLVRVVTSVLDSTMFTMSS